MFTLKRAFNIIYVSVYSFKHFFSLGKNLVKFKICTLRRYFTFAVVSLDVMMSTSLSTDVRWRYFRICKEQRIITTLHCGNIYFKLSPVWVVKASKTTDSQLKHDLHLPCDPTPARLNSASAAKDILTTAGNRAWCGQTPWQMKWETENSSRRLPSLSVVSYKTETDHG